MITPNLTQLIANTRLLAFIVNDDAISDGDVTERLTEALSSLHDLIVGSFEHYAVKQFSFTLAGGNVAGLGLNSVTLPTDFYKDNSLDRVTSASSQPETVHRFEWLDRNRTGRREYSLLGNTLVVNPVNRAQGNYVLYYTPLTPSFYPDLTPGASLSSGTTRVATSGSFSVVGGVNHLQITDGGPAFTSADVGKGISIGQAISFANDGPRMIIALDTFDHTIVYCDGPAFTPQSVIGGVTTFTVSPAAPAAATWTFPAASFGSDWVGRSFTVSGSQYSGNNGTFVIFSVTDPTTVVTVQGTPVTETINASTETIQVDGSISTLPQIYQPWYEYLQVHAAIACRDSIDLPTEAQERKLAALTKRIEAMAANRMEEPGQAAITHHRSDGGWNDGGYLP